jgi:hypothetical protein
MICIVDIQGGEPTGWILATDIHDARRKADDAGRRDIAEWCYRQEFDPGPGATQLPGMPNVWVLVS